MLRAAEGRKNWPIPALVALQVGWPSVMGDGVESFGKGWPRCMLWSGRAARVSLFLCAVAISLCHGFCAVLRSSRSFLSLWSGLRYTDIRHCCSSSIMLPCLMIPSEHGYPGYGIIKNDLERLVLP